MSEWIKCSDRMPPKDKLVLLDWGYGIGIGSPDNYETTEGAIRRGIVAYWLPIPEPHREPK